MHQPGLDLKRRLEKAVLRLVTGRFCPGTRAYSRQGGMWVIRVNISQALNIKYSFIYSALGFFGLFYAAFGGEIFAGESIMDEALSFL